MTNIDCPCEECICVPVCRNKPFMTLFNHCIFLRIYEPRYSEATRRDPHRILKIIDHLQPDTWRASISSGGHSIIGPNPKPAINSSKAMRYRLINPYEEQFKDD